MEELFNSAEFVINFIIGIILLITFFVMAHNISKIKRAIATSSKNDYFDAIDLAIFKKDHEKAKDLLYDLLFRLWKKGDKSPGERINSFEKPIRLLKSINEKVPDEISEYIEKYK